MNVIYAKEPLNFQSLSIFLAGPTPRSQEVPSWRPEAAEILEKLGFDGAVLIPEDRSGVYQGYYEDQIGWETEGLKKADVIVFWIPRDLDTLPAFTTNVEFGMWVSSGKIVAGGPTNAPKNKYLEKTSERYGVKWFSTLEETLSEALLMTEPKTEAQTVQTWKDNLKNAGHKLRSVQNEYSYPTVDPFIQVLKPEIEIKDENRVKSNEVVVIRPDLSAVVAYAKTRKGVKVVMVEEFRSAVNNPEGRVLELPGGSHPSMNPLETIKEEMLEETGLRLETSRFEQVLTRQGMSTLSTCRLHLFKVELTEEELASIDVMRTFGVEGDGEQLKVKIRDFESLFDDPQVDWSQTGMILTALKERLN